MSDTADETGGVDPSLKPFVERMRSLQSAWSALAPSGVAVAGQSIADSGRVLSQELAALARQGEPIDSDTTASLDRQLEDLAKMMTEIAHQVSPAQLRATLPARVGPDRRGVLDLLDLMIGDGLDAPAKLSARLGSIDYLVTLLCTGGEGKGIRHDPVTLTPQMNALCSHVQDQDEPNVMEIEAEFFAAASLEDEAVQEEITLRKLRQRKAELGLLFFAPRILRAVVTYNATLAERLADELWNAQDWGTALEEIVQSSATPSDGSGSRPSVFESEPLRHLAAALRRRAADGVPETNDLDRVAWCLDLDFAEGIERKSLLREDAGKRENLLGTTILVGLIQRSLAVLSVELQAVGISPDSVSDDWIPELSEILRSETNTLLEKDAYQQACVLSELKSKFLSGTPVDRPQRRVAPGSAAASDDVARRTQAKRSEEDGPRESARDLVLEALGETQGTKGDRNAKGAKSRRGKRAAKKTEDSGAPHWTASLPLTKVIPLAAGLILAVYAGVQVFGGRDLDPNLNRFGSEALANLSPHLAKGYRNGEGLGPAFVGTLRADWKELPSAARESAAEALVENLRVLGIRQVMIYDRSGALRIQAVGQQSVRTL